MVEGAFGKGDDRRNDRSQVLQHIYCTHPHYPVPVLVQKSVTQFVTLWPISSFVRLAIDFDDQRRLTHEEIHYMGTYRMLPAKLDPGLRPAKRLPEQHFGELHLPS
jgi:hypothetical protein